MKDGEAWRIRFDENVCKLVRNGICQPIVILS